MVGQPKHLSDLHKIEADVRITCRRCGFEDDWTRQALAAHLFTIGGSQVWSEITRHLRCRRFGCGSPDLRALAVPYARRPANMPRRIGKLDAKLVESAMEVLEQAVARSRGQAVATAEVCLALLVLHRYVRDRELVRSFWHLASVGTRTVDDGLNVPLGLIRQRLEQQGWIGPAVLLEGIPIWPWDSPAPPGWKAGPHHPRSHNGTEPGDPPSTIKCLSATDPKLTFGRMGAPHSHKVVRSQPSLTGRASTCSASVQMVATRCAIAWSPG